MRRLILVIFGQGVQFQCRLFRLVKASIFGVPVVLFVSYGSFCTLFGGLGWFLPGGIGANHCRLRHIGWEKCGHGLTSRPRERAFGTLAAALVTVDNVEAWPYSVGILVKWVAFLGTLHWPAAGADLGGGGISFVEILILYELWAAERLVLEKAVPLYRRPGRPISVSAVPFGLGIDIWRSCRFIGAMMRSLCLLPGGLGWFVPCSIGANHCRLRPIGWEKCGHGVTSRPRESASVPFLDELLGLFRYHTGSGRALLAGTLPLRYSAARFACLTPTWRLPVPGYVLNLFAAYDGAGLRAPVDEVGQGVHWVSGSGAGRKRIRLNRKTPAHLAGYVIHSRPRIWKRLSHVGFSIVSVSDHKRRRCDQNGGECSLFQMRTGVG